MIISEFKKTARLLKKVYAELEQEAVRNGVDLMSPEYSELQARVREATLAKLGFTLDEYREAKAKVALVPEEGQKILGLIEESELNMSRKVKAAEDRHIPTTEEIKQLAKEVFAETPPQIINKIVKEIEKPTIVKETKIEQTIVQYDDAPLREEIKNLQEGESDKIKALREEFVDYFAQSFKKNIDMLGMPDFRKLAMGMQAQIDELNSATATSIEIETPTGTIDDTNLSFTVAHPPVYIIQNGFQYFDGAGYSFNGSTITLSVPVGTGGFIRSAYQA